MGIHQKSGSLGMPQGILISTSDPRETQAKATNSLSMIISIQNTAIGICQEEFDAYVLISCYFFENAVAFFKGIW
jgi:hypothetical membrane protein